MYCVSNKFVVFLVCVLCFQFMCVVFSVFVLCFALMGHRRGSDMGFPQEIHLMLCMCLLLKNFLQFLFTY